MSEKLDKKSSATLRKQKSEAALVARGGRVIRARLNKKEVEILDSLAKEFGGITEALKHLILNNEQRSLL